MSYVVLEAFWLLVGNSDDGGCLANTKPIGLFYLFCPEPLQIPPRNVMLILSFYRPSDTFTSLDTWLAHTQPGSSNTEIGEILDSNSNIFH